MLEKTALVIGGGIAGIQAALDIASSGNKVILVEKSPGIGGTMLQLHETFPTLDCSQCILTPQMARVVHHPDIKLRVNSTITKMNGFAGNFEVVIKKKATYVDEQVCTGCRICQENCPVKNTIDVFNAGLSKKPAISILSPLAVPAIPVIDPDHCKKLTSGTCGVCEKVCPAQAIRFGDKASEEIVKAGAIIIATGCKEMDPSVCTEYGGGAYPDVITGLQFERLISSTGPTGGKLLRPSDNTVPKTVVFIQCVGSRDESKAHTYCSGICCMYTAKHAMLYKQHVPDGEAYVFYIDIRSPGKRYDEFIRQVIEKNKILYLRGLVSRIIRINNKYRVYTEDTVMGKPVMIDADMAVLACAVEPREDAAELARITGITYDPDNFYTEAHPKVQPVETTTAGIFLAGAAQGPKDITASVVQGSAAAAKVLCLFAKETL